MAKFEVGDVVRVLHPDGNYWPLGAKGHLYLITQIKSHVSAADSCIVEPIDGGPMYYAFSGPPLFGWFTKDEFLTAVYRASGKINAQTITKQQKGDHH